jgi:hypothetical protein
MQLQIHTLRSLQTLGLMPFIGQLPQFSGNWPRSFAHYFRQENKY